MRSLNIHNYSTILIFNSTININSNNKFHNTSNDGCGICCLKTDKAIPLNSKLPKATSLTLNTYVYNLICTPANKLRLLYWSGSMEKEVCPLNSISGTIEITNLRDKFTFSLEKNADITGCYFNSI